MGIQITNYLTQSGLAATRLTAKINSSKGVWMHFRCTLDMYIGCVLDAFWMHFGCILDARWMHWTRRVALTLAIALAQGTSLMTRTPGLQINIPIPARSGAQAPLRNRFGVQQKLQR